MNEFYYFPTIIYRDERPEWVDYINKISDKYFLETDFVLNQTRCMKDELNLKFFIEYLLTSSENVLKRQGYFTEKYDFCLNTIWGQEIRSSGGTNVHLHKNSQLCGWYFLEAPEKGSYPIYYDTRSNKQMIELDFMQEEEITNATSMIHFNNVIPGTVLLSNSWVQHQLSINMSEKMTKVIHFIISHKEKQTCSIC